MDLLETGAQLLSDKLGLDVDPATVQSALSSLLGDGQGGIDLAGLASRMGSSEGMAAMLGSFLGDGANDAMSGDDVMGLLGQGPVSEFANQVGTDTGNAASGLSDLLPQLLDQASSGGNLLESFAGGGGGGLLGAAKSFLS